MGLSVSMTSMSPTTLGAGG